MTDCTNCSSRREFMHVAALGLALLPIVFVDGIAEGAEQKCPFPAADGVTIDRKQQVIIVRMSGQVYAFNLSCPHENTALKWLPKDHRFQCPKHGSEYQPNGTFITGRATRNMDRLAIRRDGNDLFVDLSHIIKSDTNPAGWAAAAIAV
ncbi:MAG TPA: Rieske (2Fe-2S) protein [Vicinamibacterales bacterium]|nr:Rieske (2Fe-2S) protein [Vicinamibacterales bacterium]